MGGFNSEHVVKALMDAIKVRFKDLNEDLKPTVIASLRNWPADYTDSAGRFSSII